MCLPVFVPVTGYLLVEAIKFQYGGEGFRMMHYGRDEESGRTIIKDIAEAKEPWVLETWADEHGYTHLPIYHTDLLHRVDDSTDSLGFSDYVEIACLNARNNKSKK